MIRVFATPTGLVLQSNGATIQPSRPLTIDAIFQAGDPVALLRDALAGGKATTLPNTLRAPIQTQEVWAAGVTYYRSRTARMAESKDAGGGSFYDRVYEADRPELFFKAPPHRVVGPGEGAKIRRDSKWNVPEPELTLAIGANAKVFGFTIGNDMSSRDIEGENPLYLPQAKSYDKAAAIGPCLVVADLPGPTTVIAIEILRAGKSMFKGETTVGQIKRPLPSLADWLCREMSFPTGCYLMTGVGVVPPDDFTLNLGDEMRITIEPVGTLVNSVI
jgi:2-dehydro-3-deoxy-D-arabinonate dehydratase